MWLNLYEYGSQSYELIEKIRDTYYLVALIDNDFTSGGLDGKEFALLDSLLRLGQEEEASQTECHNGVIIDDIEQPHGPFLCIVI